MKEAEMELIGDLIHEAITHRDDEAVLKDIAERVAALNVKHPLP
jgi:glycine/serine hydroxymethyltransferase